MGGSVNVIRPDTGDVITVTEEQAAKLAPLGYEVEDVGQRQVRASDKAEEDYYTSGEQVAYTIGEGALSGLTLGGSDLLLNSENADKRAKFNPGTRMASEIVGGVAPALFTGGGSAAAGEAGTLAKLARFTPAGRLAEVGGNVSRGLGGLKGAVAGAALEGTIGGIGAQITASELNDDPFTVESAAAAGGLGGLFGAGAGALAHGLGAVGKRAQARLDEPIKLKAAYGEQADQLAKNIDEVNAKQATSLADLGDEQAAAQAKMRGEYDVRAQAAKDEGATLRSEYEAKGAAAEADVEKARLEYEDLRGNVGDETSRLRGERDLRARVAEELRVDLGRTPTAAEIAADVERKQAAELAARETLISDDSFNNLRSAIDDMDVRAGKMVGDADNAFAEAENVLASNAKRQKAQKAAGEIAKTGPSGGEGLKILKDTGDTLFGTVATDPEAWRAAQKEVKAVRGAYTKAKDVVANKAGNVKVAQALDEYHKSLVALNQRLGTGLDIPELMNERILNSVRAVKDTLDVTPFRDAARRFPKNADEFLKMSPGKAEEMIGAVNKAMASGGKDFDQVRQLFQQQVDEMLVKAGIQSEGSAGEKLLTLYNVGKSEAFQQSIKKAGAAVDNLTPIRQRLVEIETEQADIAKQLGVHEREGSQRVRSAEKTYRDAARAREGGKKAAERELSAAEKAREKGLRDFEAEMERTAKSQGRDLTKAERTAAREGKARMQYLKKEQRRLEKELDEKLGSHGGGSSRAGDFLARRLGATAGKKAAGAIGLGGLGMMMGGDFGAMAGFMAISNFAGAKAAVMSRLTSAAAKWAPRASRVQRFAGPRIDPLVRSHRDGTDDDHTISRSELFKKRVDELAELAAAGPDRAYKVASQLEAQGHPGFAAALHKQAMNALGQATSVMPKDDGKTPWGFESLWEPTPAQMEVFGRVSRAVFDPLESIEALSSGDVHPAEVKALQTAWPELYGRWKGEMLKQLSEPGMAKSLYRQDWSELSIALDMDFMATQRPQWIAAQQQMHAQRNQKKPGNPSGPVGRPPGPGPMSTAAQSATER